MRIRPSRRTAAMATALALAGSALAAGAWTAAGTPGRAAPAPRTPKAAPAGTAFWTDVPAKPPAGAKPGDVLWTQRRADAPRGARGWNVVYVSEIQPGVKAYVSGEVYAPARSGGRRDLVLWNHPTAGLNDDCAPSRQTLGTANNQVPALERLLAQGHVVAMSDYPGLGLSGPAYYMTGDPNARASLDVLRAARKLPGVRASTRYVQYGWSQGGQTSEHVEAIAASYAPEFRGLGTGLIAPAVRIRDLTLNSMKSPGLAGYVIATLRGIQAAYPKLRYGDFLTAEGMEALPDLADGCFDVWQSAGSLKKPYKPGAMAAGSPWSTAMSDVDAFHPRGSMPFVIFQGSADTTVPPALTRKEWHTECAAGSRVKYVEVPGKTHTTIVPSAAAAFPSWAAGRFAGKPAPSTCT